MSLSWKLLEKIDEAENIDNSTDFSRWRSRVKSFLEAAMDYDTAKRFDSLSDDLFDGWRDGREKQLGYLEGLASAKNEGEDRDKPVRTSSTQANSNDVFIVHGHDEAVKALVARFTEQLGLNPIILHEKPNSGMTIIEKFESFSNVGYAIVLLTPDDVGASAKDSDKLMSRARQNVILELGYFAGKLGRKKVCALYKGDVEIPSDFSGVLYTEMDKDGAWRTKLAQELSNAGMKINLDALLHS